MVSDAEQILKLIDSGEVNRHFGETNMNVHSSRSHTIFKMVIESRGKENSSSDAIRVSVLNLVDLAGSEQMAKTGAGGVRLTEGKYINKSLMILGNVINKLSDSAELSLHSVVMRRPALYALWHQKSIILRNGKELSKLQTEPSASPIVPK